MADITHSNDAGRYGKSKPSDLVRSFMNLAGNLQAVDQMYTDRGVTVELTYTPNSMDIAGRQALLGELLSFAEDQQSWDGCWFLWNLINVNDNGQNIRLCIA